MKSLPKILLACLMLAAFAACGPQKSASTETSTTDSSDVVAADTNAGEMDPTQEYEVPESPPAKSKAERDALGDLWVQAVKREKEFLGTPRISEWVAGLEASPSNDPEDEYFNGKIDKASLKSLTTKELVYYVVFHPEYWDQICAEALYDVGMVQGISSDLPMNVDYLSDDQDAAVKAKRDSVEAVVVSCLRTTQAVSEAMLHLVCNYQFKAAVGPLCDIYKAQKTKDDLILSALIKLMNNANFKPWVESELVKAESDNMREWFPLNSVNADKIMFYAKKYAAS